MTNTQRDELLISMAKSISNIQVQITELRQEFKADLKETENNLRKEFKADLKQTEENLRKEFKSDLKQTEENLRKEFKAELKEQLRLNAIDTVELIKDTWHKEINDIKEVNKRLDQHEKDIKMLKQKLA